jgi:serine kinase of HPr protein (carbohydrate metabolism regulator)
VIRHAGLVAQLIGGYWRGALIEGPSGSGKSDLALRGLAAGLRLVADDRVVLWTSAGRLYGRAPASLRGLLEVRGLDVVTVPLVDFSEVVVIARLATPAARIPEFHTENVLGVLIPTLDVAPFEASAPAKLGRAIQAFAAAHNGRM